MFEARTARSGKLVAGGNLLGGGEGYESKAVNGIVQSARLWACPDVGFLHEWRQTDATLPSGTIHRPDYFRTACRGSRLSGGKGLSGAVPAIGNEPGRGTLPVASAVLVRALDIALFWASLA